MREIHRAEHSGVTMLSSAALYQVSASQPISSPFLELTILSQDSLTHSIQLVAFVPPLL